MLPILQKNKTDNIYKNWIKTSYDYFSKCKDEDFFSDKMTHLYFYGEVNDENVQELFSNLQEASKTQNINGVKKPPKPICLHLNSGGGLLSSSNLFNSMIKMQRTPFCVITENDTASAATIISLLAPYRLMIEHSSYLIHDMSNLMYSKKSNSIHKNHRVIYEWLQNYIPLLRKRTKLTEEEIKLYIKRDLYLDDKYCKKKGIIDRILKFKKINTPDKYNDKNQFSNVFLSLPTLLKKTNLNNIYIDPNSIDSDKLSFNQNDILNIEGVRSLNDLCIAIDKFFLADSSIKKQLILHFLPTEKEYSSPLRLINLCYRISLLQKKIPVIAFIEGYQTLETLGLILTCPIRIMVKPSVISSYLTFNQNGVAPFSWKVIDLIKNTEFILKQIKSFLKKNSKLPVDFYNNLDKEIITYSPNELKKYEVVHLILKDNNSNITKNELINYLDLNKVFKIKNKRK